MRKKLLIIFILAFVFRIALSLVTSHPDIWSNADWGIRYFQYGPSLFYAPQSNVWSFTWPNQPPGTIYMFAFVYQLFRQVFNLVSIFHFSLHILPGKWLLFLEENHLYYSMLKLPSIVSDLGIGYLIYRIFKEQGKEKLGRLGAIFFLVNPLIWYNSAVWGQTDAVINFLALASLYFLLKRKILIAAIILAISLYTKVSLAIFVPLFVIIAIRQKYKISEYLKAIIIPSILILVFTLPFSGKAEPVGWLYQIYTQKVLTNQLQIITANAFNLWAAIAGINEQPQSLPFLFLNYQIWGQIFFAIAYIPLLFMLWKDQKPIRVFWVFALTAFSSWMLLTNMHERYLYPLFPFFTILVINDKRLRVFYWIISIISLLNLYNFWFVPRIAPIIAVMNFSDHVVARFLGLSTFILFLLLYVKFLRWVRLKSS